jgi:hypothetical protein
MGGKLHWFAWAFASGNVQASVYIGYGDKNLTRDKIFAAKDGAGVPSTAMLMAVSYLGHMTKEVFEGEARNDAP